jgi:hypothetical protein
VERPPAAEGDFTLEQARAFDAFPLSFAGERVDGLPLVAVLRRADTATYVSFVYGDCTPLLPGEGCAPPAEIQVAPRGARGGDLYRGGPGAPTPEPAVARGCPAAFFDGGRRLELYGWASTVTIFAATRERVLRIAAALRPLGAAPKGGGELPACRSP